MRLILDFGNTLKKLAVYDADRPLAFYAYDRISMAVIRDIVSEHTSIDAAILSSVIRYPISIRRFLRENYNFIELSEHTPVPITVRYKTPRTLGKDRLAAVVGANFSFPDRNILVINAGTCITYDFIDNKGVYHGGSISPGIRMRFSALYTFTDKLPLISCFDETMLTGEDTVSSMCSGVMNGIRAEIDGIIGQYKQQKPGLVTVLSGGDAKYFEKSLKNSIFAVPNIVTEGLRIILNHNVEK